MSESEIDLYFALESQGDTAGQTTRVWLQGGGRNEEDKEGRGCVLDHTGRLLVIQSNPREV